MCVFIKLHITASVYVCVCVIIPFILEVRFVDVPAGVIQEEGRTGFLHLPFAVLALIISVRRIQRFFSLVDREVEFCVLTIYYRSPLVGHLYMGRCQKAVYCLVPAPQSGTPE